SRTLPGPLLGGSDAAGAVAPHSLSLATALAPGHRLAHRPPAGARKPAAHRPPDRLRRRAPLHPGWPRSGRHDPPGADVRPLVLRGSSPAAADPSSSRHLLPRSFGPRVAVGRTARRAGDALRSAASPAFADRWVPVPGTGMTLNEAGCRSAAVAAAAP